MRGCAVALPVCSLAMMGQLSSEALLPLSAPDANPPPADEHEPNTNCAMLKALDLTGCGGVNGLGLASALAHGGRHLAELSLRGHVSMPSAHLLAVLGCCPKLVQLDVSCCLSLDDEGVCQLAKACPLVSEHTTAQAGVSGTHSLGCCSLACSAAHASPVRVSGYTNEQQHDTGGDPPNPHALYPMPLYSMPKPILPKPLCVPPASKSGRRCEPDREWGGAGESALPVAQHALAGWLPGALPGRVPAIPALLAVGKQTPRYIALHLCTFARSLARWPPQPHRHSDQCMHSCTESPMYPGEHTVTPFP